MRATLFLFLIFTSSLFALEANSQVAKVSITAQSIQVGDLLNKIESQTEYLFIYNKSDVDVGRKVSVDTKNKTVAEVLHSVFEPTDVIYVMEGNNIMLMKGSSTSTKSVQDDNKKIDGTVVDQDNLPVIGATVSVKGTTVGTLTDMDGNFSFEVPNNATLIVSYIGYSSVEMAVGNKTKLNISLMEDVRLLDEVVVVGYGVQKKVNLTGAVSQITSSSIESRPINSLAQGLQGSIPNLNVALKGGKPGEDASFNIRGIVSINEAKPLCIVDGVSMDLNMLNPDDVETISVLKDAASAAIYGARASAGVILVTTKSGANQKDGKVRVSYSNNFQWSKPTRIPKMVNTLEFMEANNESSERTNGQGNKPYPDFWMEAVRKRMEDPANNPLTLNIDDMLYYCDNEGYYDKVLRSSSPRQKHTLSVSRGTDKTNFYLSGAFMDEKGLIKLNPDEYKQYNINMSVNTEVNQYLSLGASYKLNKSNLDEPAVRENIGDIWYALPGTPPHRPIQREDGQYMGQVTAYLAQAGRRLTDRMDNWVSFNATGKILPGWIVKGDFTYNYYTEDYKNHLTKVVEAAERVNQFWIKNDTGVDMSTRTRDNYQMNVFTQYDKSLGDHNFSALVGFNQEWEKEKYHMSTRKDLIIESIPEINLATGSEYVKSKNGHSAIRGAFYRLTYNWKSRYLLEMNGRYDGTSRFPKDYRFKFFPSFSGAWRISDESFMKSAKTVLDDLKVRASYGTLGNQQVGKSLYFESLKNDRVNWLFGSGNGLERPSGLSAGKLVDPRPTWEKTATVNLGLDVSLFYKLNLTGDIYKRKTTDMLTSGLTLPAVLGAEPPTMNAADLETKGWELAITWRDGLSNGLKYEASFILADNTSKITKVKSNEAKLLRDKDGKDLFYEGKQLGEIWGFVTDGIYQSEEEIASGNDQSALHGGVWTPGDVKYLDLDGDEKITYGEATAYKPGDQKVIGNLNPRYTFGIRGNVDYKGVDLSFFLQGVGKRDMYFNNFMYWGPIKTGDTQITRELYSNVWNESRRDAFYPSLKNASYNSHVQSRYIEDASYMRLKNLTIGYTLPRALVKKALLEKIRLYVSGENLFEITSMNKTFDPETTAHGGDNYPFYRSFSFGVQVNL